jgi:hypothetical protein
MTDPHRSHVLPGAWASLSAMTGSVANSALRSSASAGRTPWDSSSSSPYSGPKSGRVVIALPAYLRCAGALRLRELSLAPPRCAVNAGAGPSAAARRARARRVFFRHNTSFRLKPQVIICCPVLWGPRHPVGLPVGVRRHGRREPRSVVATASAGCQQRADAATAAGPDADAARRGRSSGRENPCAWPARGGATGPAEAGTRCQRCADGEAAAAASPVGCAGAAATGGGGSRARGRPACSPACGSPACGSPACGSPAWRSAASAAAAQRSAVGPDPQRPGSRERAAGCQGPASCQGSAGCETTAGCQSPTGCQGPAGCDSTAGC